MIRDLYDDDHESFRDTVRRFVSREVIPHQQQWEADRLIGREVWKTAGQLGVLGISVPAAYGGGGMDDFRYRCVVIEELELVGAASLHSGFSVHDDIVTPYLVDLGTELQKKRWLPSMCSGEVITAIAMTEPGTGSDLRSIRTTARRDGDGWVLDGQKTFISNGIQSDLVIVVAQTDTATAGWGLSLFLVDRNTPGFSRGRKLDKVGLHAQDTAELFFENARVPDDALLGEAGSGLRYLKQRLPRERLAIAVSAICAAEAVFGWTREFCAQREAFGRPIAQFQNTRFVLAELATAIDVTRTYIDAQIKALNAGTLTDIDAAKAKWWATDVQVRTTDKCLQLHGGYGYMIEYPVARAFIDSRVQPIYGGTNEIMKDIIGRDLFASTNTDAT